MAVSMVSIMAEVLTSTGGCEDDATRGCGLGDTESDSKGMSCRFSRSS